MTHPARNAGNWFPSETSLALGADHFLTHVVLTYNLVRPRPDDPDPLNWFLKLLAAEHGEKHSLWCIHRLSIATFDKLRAGLIPEITISSGARTPSRSRDEIGVQIEHTIRELKSGTEPVSARQICERLDAQTVPRPPGSTWKALSWRKAYDDPKHGPKVRSYISRR